MGKHLTPRQYRLAVTLETASGRIIRPLTVTAPSLVAAKGRAGIVAKPGQRIVAVEVTR